MNNFFFIEMTQIFITELNKFSSGLHATCKRGIYNLKIIFHIFIQLLFLKNNYEEEKMQKMKKTFKFLS